MPAFLEQGLADGTPGLGHGTLCHREVTGAIGTPGPGPAVTGPRSLSPVTASSLAARYHERTKYTPEALARGASRIDLRHRPPPYKPWVQGGRIPLGGNSPDDHAPGGATDHALDRVRLGRLLHHTYGVTQILHAEGQTLSLRAAPSAGGLYPTELYVATRDIAGIPNGLWAYHGGDHLLLACWEGDFLPDLGRAAFDVPAFDDADAVIVVSGFYERSSWRYQDRAYRRVLLDAGHVAGNAVLAGDADRLGVTLIPDFLDDAVDGLLLFDPAREGTLLLGTVGRPPGGAIAAGLRSQEERPPDASDEGNWIPLIHGAGRLGPSRARATPAADAGVPDGPLRPLERGAPLPGGAPVLEAIRRRRSTRRFRQQEITATTMGSILAHGTARRAGLGPPSLAPGLVETYVAVASVAGIPPGVYRYDPQRHGLVQRAVGAVRMALYQAALGQELARDAAFTVIHAFDLPAAVARYGDRAYRTAHLDAGIAGQSLDLAALRLGLGASGIGGFFDDLVNALLGLPPAYAIAYLTTVGVPA